MFLPTNNTTKSVTDLREDTLALLDTVKKEGLVYIFQHSSPKAVMLSMDEFAQWQEMLEDRLDELDAKILASTPRGKGIKIEDIENSF